MLQETTTIEDRFHALNPLRMQTDGATAIDLHLTNNSYEGPAWVEEFMKKFGGTMQGNVYRPETEFGKGIIHAGTLYQGLSYLLINCYFTEDAVFTFSETNSAKGILLYNPKDTGHVDEVEVEKNKKGYMRFLEGLYFADSSRRKTVSFIKDTHVRMLAIFFDCKWFKESFCPQTGTNPNELAFCNNQPGSFTHHALSADQKMMLNSLLSEDIEESIPALSEQSRILMLAENGLKNIIEHSRSTRYFHINPEEKELLLQAEKELLNDFTTAPPTIKVLARLSCMSETSFKVKFKKMFGLNVYEYYQHFRLHRAKQLLESGKYNIKEVGFRIGYSNMSHFSKNFKKKFGILPSEFLHSSQQAA